jgi:hypothetical protein
MSKKVTKLTPSQSKVFEELISHLDVHIKNRKGDEHNQLYYHSPDTWYNIIYNLATSVSNNPVDIKKDCWLVEIGEKARNIDAHGYPRFKITEVSYRQKSPSQGKRLYSIDGYTPKTTHQYKMAVVLMYPELLGEFQKCDHNKQTAHRCYHKLPLCFNPHHIIPLLSDKENKDMHKCVRANASNCPGHGPEKIKCIYTTPYPHGRWIPCRNEPIDSECNHIPKCAEIQVGEEAETDELLNKIVDAKTKKRKRCKQRINKIHFY